MKKNLINLSLIGLLLFSSSVYAEKALPTPQKLKIDDKEVTGNMQIYNINNENYFRLRDFAGLVNGTDRMFSVIYDKYANEILIEKNQFYIDEGVSSEGDMKSVKKAVQSSQNLYIDGTKCNLKAFNIDGNNYYRLRDLGMNLDIGVDYDKNTNTVLIDTVSGYIGEKPSDNKNSTSPKKNEKPVDKIDELRKEAEKDEKYQNALKEWMTEHIRHGMSEEEKVKIIHDWIINNAEYTAGKNGMNSQGYSIYTPQAIFFGNGGFSQSYSQLFYDLADLSGLNVKYVNGIYDNGKVKLTHAWNMVNINGKWYHIDVTLDDPVNDKNNILRYDYYLKSDNFMRKNHKWSGMPEAKENFPQNYKSITVPVNSAH